MELGEGDVEEALTRLRNQRLVWQVKAHGSRALKYEHNVQAVAEFSDREIGILCVLLLRGPQTAGELKSRTTRLAEFHGLAAVEHTLQKLITHEKGPFVHRIDRRPGQKEDRYGHLLEEFSEPPASQPNPTDSFVQSSEKEAEDERMDVLERKVEDLHQEMENLKAQFKSFKNQFE